MTREARMISGIILITVPTIQYGGYFPRWPRPRGRYRDFVTGLPDRGCGSSSNTYALVRSNRSATLRDSHFGGVLLLSTARNGYSSQWSGRPDLRRGSDSRCWGCHAWRWVVAVSSTELGSSRFRGVVVALRCSGCFADGRHHVAKTCAGGCAGSGGTAVFRWRLSLDRLFITSC